MVAGLGSVPLGVVVPVVVCVGVLRRPVCLMTFGAGPGMAPRGGGLLGNEVRWRRAGRGVRRVVLCGVQGSWGAVGSAGVGAPTLVGW